MTKHIHPTEIVRNV